MSFNKVGVAVSTLNQHAQDFVGNVDRIIRSIKQAQLQGAAVRIGPELEICGYSCEDSFFEMDTVHHCWDMLCTIIQDKSLRNILIDTGMPIYKDGSLYNCRVLLLNQKIIAIRAKSKLADGGNYRESRWFTPWTDPTVVWYQLTPEVQHATGQSLVPFGRNFVLEFPHMGNSLSGASLVNASPFRIGFEICEELWRPDAEHIRLYKQMGCQLVCNSSGSYWELRKLNRVLQHIQSATAKCGGFYAFSNLLGCDGTRICFYGRSLICANGHIVCQTTHEDGLFRDCETCVAFLDLNDVTAYRSQYKLNTEGKSAQLIQYDVNTGYSASGLSTFASGSASNLVISVTGFNIFSCNNEHVRSTTSCSPTKQTILCPEREIQLYASLWLWDYLRRCKFARGFIIPLSGGLDSASVALLVYSMCTLLFRNYDVPQVRCELRRLLKMHNLNESQLKSPQQLCSLILRCMYLRTKFSGMASQVRAAELAQLIGGEFAVVDFTSIYEQIGKVCDQAFASQTNAENQSASSVTVLQQNLQARLRMVLTYYASNGNRLVLATGNVDEALVGYLTKYDCSSADLNPIGSISKEDLRKFIRYTNQQLLAQDSTIIRSILDAVPSAELSGAEQEDEKEIGLTYKELSLFGSLRKGDLGCYGPYGMFCKLWSERKNAAFAADADVVIENNPHALAEKVKRFFRRYGQNRHKQTVLTPALHAVTYSPDDNRFDHRQFLYSDWTWQFKCINEQVAQITSNAADASLS